MQAQKIAQEKITKEDEAARNTAAIQKLAKLTDLAAHTSVQNYLYVCVCELHW